MSTGAPPSPAQQHNHEPAKPSAGAGSGVLKASTAARQQAYLQVPPSSFQAPSCPANGPQLYTAPQLERSTRKAPSTCQGAGPVSCKPSHPASLQALIKPWPTGMHPAPPPTALNSRAPPAIGPSANSPPATIS
jgi:hypothetical protein